jgi:hypothetical protein
MHNSERIFRQSRRRKKSHRLGVLSFFKQGRVPRVVFSAYDPTDFPRHKGNFDVRVLRREQEFFPLRRQGLRKKL